MRSEAREAAFKIVFAELFNPDCGEKFRRGVCKQAELGEEDTAFALSLAACVDAHREELISDIAERVTGYAEHRIYAADKAAIMLALAEIRYFDDIPPVVSVSEATALARKYSTERSADFVNGVLGGFINK